MLNQMFGSNRFHHVTTIQYYIHIIYNVIQDLYMYDYTLLEYDYIDILIADMICIRTYLFCNDTFLEIDPNIQLLNLGVLYLVAPGQRSHPAATRPRRGTAPTTPLRERGHW